MEKGYARLQQIGEHGVMEIVARLHADLHVKEAAGKREYGTSDDAERVYVYGIYGAEQAVWIQSEDQSKETIIAYALELFGISVFVTPDVFQVGPVWEPVIISSGSDLTDEDRKSVV